MGTSSCWARGLGLRRAERHWPDCPDCGQAKKCERLRWVQVKSRCYLASMREPVEFPVDPVIEAYKKHVDDSLLVAQLGRSPTERIRAVMEMQRLVDEMRRAQAKQRETR